MSNPAFLIDGFTEKIIIGKICQGSPIRRIDMNGKNVRIDKMAEKIASIIKVLGNKYYPIVILVDREGRQISREDMENQLIEELEKKELNCELIVGVADKMIENWMIADWDNIKRQTGTNAEKPEVTDGIGGKGAIRRIYSEYHETVDGPNFFISSNPDIIKENSPSFKSFSEKLGGINCYWMGTTVNEY